ncbi:unnamed protein product, partial [Ectocarpus sp. 12 AP-2014]
GENNLLFQCSPKSSTRMLIILLLCTACFWAPAACYTHGGDLPDLGVCVCAVTLPAWATETRQQFLSSKNISRFSAYCFSFFSRSIQYKTIKLEYKTCSSTTFSPNTPHLSVTTAAVPCKT